MMYSSAYISGTLTTSQTGVRIYDVFFCIHIRCINYIPDRIRPPVGIAFIGTLQKVLGK